LGYAGVFLVSVLGNATLVLPAPALVFVFAAGGSLDSFWLVGVLAGIGATIGECTGYLAGYSGSDMVNRMHIYLRVKKWVQRYGAWAIGILAFIPNPLFDFAGLAAGAMKMRWQTFIAATLVGKLAKNILVAYAGSVSLGWISRVFF
jgi:membrane protein YqaA with SNARE-associated domain